MYKQLVLVVSFAVGLKYLFMFRKWLDADKDFLYRIAPGPCVQVLTEGGSEDMAHIGNGVFILSSGIGFPTDKTPLGQGQMMVLNTNGRQPTVYKANVTNFPAEADFFHFPHGITTWKDPKTGVTTVYLLTHPAKEDKVRVFEIQRNGDFRYIRSITDPKFKFMNNLIAVGKDKFYITKCSEYRGKNWRIAMLIPTVGDVYYYDGSRAREVVTEGFRLANGINVSPDGSTVYVAEFATKTLHAYRRERNNNLVKLWSYYLDTGVDNIEVDPDTGDLWIGCHPVFFPLVVDYFNLYSYLPSQVKLTDGIVSDVVEVYADDGREASASTVGSYYNGKLVVGSLDKETVVCDVKYTD